MEGSSPLSPYLETALVVTLALMLVIVSAIAGALGWQSRSRSRPGIDLVLHELAERLRRLDALLARLEVLDPVQPPSTEPEPHRPAVEPRPSATLRFDRAAQAIPGPTLIAVPDLSANAVEPSPASAELGRRFGAIWDLADAGESTETVASRTGYPIGQVELILGLRRQLISAEARA
jgi:hypothetical protein